MEARSVLRTSLACAVVAFGLQTELAAQFPAWKLVPDVHDEDPERFSPTAYGQSVSFAAQGVIVGNTNPGEHAIFSRVDGQWEDTGRFSIPHFHPDSYGWNIASSDSLVVMGGRRGTVVAFPVIGDSVGEAVLVLPRDRSNSRMTWSVAVEGNIAVIGSIGTQSMGPGPDALDSAFIVERQGPEWTTVAKLAASDHDDRDIGFGWSVALVRDCAFVGAPSAEAVFVYRRIDGSWLFSQRLVSPRSGVSGFGVSLSADGDRLLVGAPHQRSAYLFERVGHVWNHAATFSGGSGFGRSVALHGARAVVSAPGVIERQFLGSVYAFERIGSEWVMTGRLVAPERVNTSDFGSSLAVNGNWALVGSPLRTNGLGHAWIFDITTSLETVTEIDVLPPDVLSIDALYPSPVSSTAEIEFTVPEPGHVRIDLYDVLGRQVSQLFDGQQEAGANTVVFSVDDYPSGLYVVRIRSRDAEATTTVVVNR